MDMSYLLRHHVARILVDDMRHMSRLSIVKGDGTKDDAIKDEATKDDADC